jgi:hypothetical protein
MFGASVMLVFGATTTMFTESMPRRSTGGVAVNKFVRNVLNCGGTVAAQPLIDAMGHGWLMTMIGLISGISSYGCVLLLKSRSSAWRLKMNENLWSNSSKPVSAMREANLRRRSVEGSRDS